MTNQDKLGKDQLLAIWEQSDNSYDLVQIAFRHGYLKGQTDQLRKTDHHLNAVLNILENQNAN
jgi:hypothetical protein